jgi:Flp pilus assembly protein TadG
LSTLDTGKKQRAARQRGAELVEFGLVLIPLLGFVFITCNLAWCLFNRATLQYAVREGVRYAVTSRTLKDKCHVDSIKTVVQNNSFGLLNGTQGWDRIHVSFTDPVTFKEGTNAGGQIVEVSVEGYSMDLIAPLLTGGNVDKKSMTFEARSADRMQPSPSGGAPCM